jgi:hypothetical protein
MFKRASDFLSFNRGLSVTIGLLLLSTLLGAGRDSSVSTAATPSILQQDLQQTFRKYELAQLNTADVAKNVLFSGRLSIFTPSHSFELNLVPNDLRAPNYRAEEVIEGGITRELAPTPVRTYKGTVVGDSRIDARFTIDESTLEGMIIAPDKTYFVEKAQKYSVVADANAFVIYTAADVLAEPILGCGVTLKDHVNLRLNNLSQSNPEFVSPNRVIEVATEADFDYVRFFYTSAGANDEILSILNQVQGIYETQLGLTLKVIFQHAWATSTDPYTDFGTGTGDASMMLDEFRNYWNANFTGIPRDTSMLWTNRMMDAAGIAFVNVMCSSPGFSYGISGQWPRTAQKVGVPAHELAHNLGATHSDGIAGCEETIMQGTSSNFTTLNFCPFSLNEITTYVSAHSGCLDITTFGASHFQFAKDVVAVTEGTSSISITVTRTGNSDVAKVDFATSDLSAHENTDYVVNAGTLVFAPGETTKTITFLISDDLYHETSEEFRITLSNPVGGSISNPGWAIIAILDNDNVAPTTNPLDNPQTFVRQHYYDFLNRLPDQSGLDYWSSQISTCGSDLLCVNRRRVDISNAFFYELEFQQTGAYVYRLYRLAFGNDQPFPNPDVSAPAEAKKLPSYLAFVRDRARVVGGSTLAGSQIDLANSFVTRAEFLSRYPASLSGPQFIDALLARISSDSGVDLGSQRVALISLLDQGGRAAVLYRLADDNMQTNPIVNRPFLDAEYNRSFVYTQYAGYLRRDPDVAGFLFWLGQVNQFPVRDANIQHTMVCAFLTSREYQQRFSAIVTHSNGECGQ